jgi:tRNA threonylcarbamoyladenosine biosynthesis protein TsaB
MAKLAKHEQAQGRTIPAEQAVPVYLRDNVAKKKGEQ